MKNKLSSILTKSSVKVVTVLGFSFLLVTVVSAQTWNPAPASPPSNNAPTPINVSNTAQSKTGAFSSVGGIATGRTTLPTIQGLVLEGIAFPLNSLKLFVQGQSVFNSDDFTQLYLRGSRADRVGGLTIANNNNEYLRFEIAGDGSALTGLGQGDSLISANKNLQFRGNSGNGTVRTAQLFIQGSTGNVGIGTGNVAPTSRLTVAGSGAFSGELFSNKLNVVSNNPEIWFNEKDETTADAGLWRFQGWNGNLHLLKNTAPAKDFTAQTRILSMLTNGNVGVGVVPESKLDVDGQIRLRGGDPEAGKVLVSDSVGLASWIDPNDLGLEGGGGSNWTLNANNNLSNNNTAGNVGIGIADPNYKLHVVGTSPNGQVFRSQFANTNTTGATNIQLFNGGTHAASIGVNGPNRNVPNASFNNWGWLHNGGGGWAFFAGPGDGLSNLKMVVAPSGNVGIGTTNPSSLLSLRGNSDKLAELKIEGTNDVTNNNIGLNVDSARNAHVILDRGNIGQTSYVRYATGGATDWYAGINARQNNDYQISNTFNATVGQLTIKKDTGNVGIGTNNPATKLDVNTGGISGGVRIKTNSTSDSVNGNLSFTNTTSDEIHSQITSGRNGGTNGNLSFSTRQAGVLREVLRLTEGGNVGIGISSPGAKLEVNGSSIIRNGLAVLGGNTLLGSRPAGAGLELSPASTKLEVNGSVRLNTFNVTGGTPGLNKILASVDNIGTVAWKTTEELGLTGTGGGGASEWELIGTGPNINNSRFGSVGIGTNIIDGSDKVNIKGALRVTSNQNDEYLRISRETGFGQIQTYNSEPLFVNPIGNNTILNQGNGNVGVGTTAPNEKLEVSGGLRITNPSTNEYLRISRETGFSKIQSYNQEYLSINPEGNNTILNSGAGNVGIGTNSPNSAAKLDVVGNIKASNFITAPYINAEAGGFVMTPKIIITEGVPAPGKVLTATDSSGNATWQDGGGISANQISTRSLIVSGDKGVVTCENGGIAMGGGISYTGNRNGNFGGPLGIAEGQGSAFEITGDIFGFLGRGSITGSTNLRAPISRPGNATNANNVSSWYCEIPDRPDGSGTFTCYARCLSI